MTDPVPYDTVLVLRLAGPLQSWGSRSAFNRRETNAEPTKSGVLGLLAAAEGRPREQSLADLLPLRLGVRVDQPGTLLRDYHTVSDYRDRPLLQAGVNTKGVQKPTSPVKETHVTTRYYLQDALFVAAVTGPGALLETLEEAVRRPAFPLALGRRSCVPTQPLSLGLHHGDLENVLAAIPWQAPEPVRQAYGKSHGHPQHIDRSATLEDPAGDDVAHDVPESFAPRDRRFHSRNVRHTWLAVPTGFPARDTATAPGPPEAGHDPFALLSW